MRRHPSLLALIALAMPLGVAAQSVRGVVTDAGGVPVPGVLVQLVSGDTGVVARALTDARGHYLLAGAAASTYRVRTLRIGFRPEFSAPLTLEIGREVAQAIRLSALPARLDTVRVGGRNACGRAATGPAAEAVATIWEQVRAAISATELSGTQRSVVTASLDFDRLLDEAGWRVLRQRTSVRTDGPPQPWAAPPPSSLHAFGYITAGADSTSYRAPGLDMLASTTFIDDHCFRLANGRDQATIGVVFEPTDDRRNLPEIRGTVFVDRASSELRGMEFRYVYRESPDLVDGARGSMDFARFSNGTWAISRWEIRMPIREIRSGAAGPRAARTDGASTRVVTTGVRVTGGELALAMSRGDTLFAKPPVTVRGEVRDSASGRGIGGAQLSLQGTALSTETDADGRFALTNVLPGEYALEIRTPGLDSIGTADQRDLTVTDGKEVVRYRVPSVRQVVDAMCGAAYAGRGIPGIVSGSVATLDDSAPPAGTALTLEWTDPATRVLRSASAATDAAGNFLVCGAPVGVGLVLRASADSLKATPVAIALAPEKPAEVVRLTLDRRAAPTGTVAGVVVSDSGRAVVIDAEVILPDAARSARSDSSGAFLLRDVPIGEHRVMVRRPGYGPLDAMLSVRANEVVNRRMVLARVTVLNEVVIAAGPRPLPEFEANRKLGLGVFMTRDFLATQEGRRLATVFGAVPGVRVWNNSGGKRGEFIASSRICKPAITYGPGGAIEQKCTPCFADVFVDGHHMTRRGDRFDVNSIEPADIEAIEYYRGASESPGRYRTAVGACGVLVIHTRLGKR
ncbi:MAG: carboxypeptidase regulatory-like domain-containing protein [Gemmatimonadota bacterium]|nr:carboxypeptidase regulatory-like domain-containing protein [Gemmatimonadota bacterium]